MPSALEWAVHSSEENKFLLSRSHTGREGGREEGREGRVLTFRPGCKEG